MSRSAIRNLRRRLAVGAVAVMFLGAVPAAWPCAIPAMEVVSGAVRGVAQEPGADPASPWGPDLPGAILVLQGSGDSLRFRLSRNIGMTLEELRARARDGRAVRVKYERLYDGHLRALEVVAADGGR